jgi:hypothetical protein
MLMYWYTLQEFEVDLDGAQTLRILGYKIVGDQSVLLGKCALEVGSILAITLSCLSISSILLLLVICTYSAEPCMAARRLFGENHFIKR